MSGETRCPRAGCGRLNPAVNAFCYYCGASLRQPVIPTPGAHTVTTSSTGTPRLTLYGKGEIRLTTETIQLGRDELAGMVPENELRYISRQHLIIGFENGQYYIEDRNSTNGTKLNGVQIRGKGKHRLHQGDQIQLADAVTFSFEVF